MLMPRWMLFGVKAIYIPVRKQAPVRSYMFSTKQRDSTAYRPKKTERPQEET